MGAQPLWSVEWRREGEVLVAIEPTPEEIASAAAALATAYNDAHNSRMMGHAAPLSPEEVVVSFEELRAEEGRPFLLQQAGVLMGDGDLRNIEGRTGELAIMIGGRGAQGRGLGTRFAIMLHAFAFGVLGLERIYVSIIPANTASRRLFEKLGYELDDSPEAREFIDDETDLTLSVERARFEDARGAELAEIRLHERLIGPAGSKG